MEAVPRLPMINFELKTSTEKVTFGPKVKQYIAGSYHEDPESYNEEVHNLDSLRGVATRPVIDVTGCQMLKKYYCQLHFLKSRFPMEEGQPASIAFSWKDTYSNMVCTVTDIDFELSCILYNIGALHSQLGSMDSRSNPDGMKMACTHFQCAAWAFQTLRENYFRMVACLLPPELMNFMKQICLAQAQECILEKSMLDNRKATIIAKVAVQVVDYYRKSLTILQTGTEDGSFGDILGNKVYKKWCQYITFKVSYHKCVSLLYQGQQSEEQQKMGERVAFYQAACENLEEARKLSSSLQYKEQIDEALAFTQDVVEGKRKAAKNENEFIYHEDVPDKSYLQEVKGASLVKGIPFNVNDAEVSGTDIFARLVPMEAHEASSMYSEHKAKMLRQLGELVESKDQALAEFLSSLQLDGLQQIKCAKGLTQEIVDRAAAISARPKATQELISAMGKLSDIYHDVEAMLKETQELLKEEEQSERNYQILMGKRPPSIIATDLSREYQKYTEAHNKASESNLNLHKAMTTHVANLKILALPLPDLQQQIPSIELPNPNIDVEAMEHLEKLMRKVDEMKSQRAGLWNELRDAVHNDDITGVLVTRQPEQSLEDVFKQEMEKHNKLGTLIEKNTAAQENILKALVNMYAEFSDSRKYIQDIVSRRNATMSALITSYDTYEDLLSKAQKGLEFYNKLETNVTKLLQRVRGACKVQQEEREQILLKNRVDSKPAVTSSATTRTPKLKDYLDSMKGKDAPEATQYPGNYALSSSDGPVWPPAVRPTPLGSEVTSDSPACSTVRPESSYNFGANQVPYNSQQYAYEPPVNKSADDDVIQRMASLMAKDNSASYNQGQYGQYNANQHYNTYSYAPNNANTYSTNSYQPISSVAEPYANYAGYDGSNAGTSTMVSGSAGVATASSAGSSNVTNSAYGYGCVDSYQQQGYNQPAAAYQNYANFNNSPQPQPTPSYPQNTPYNPPQIPLDPALSYPHNSAALNLSQPPPEHSFKQPGELYATQNSDIYNGQIPQQYSQQIYQDYQYQAPQTLPPTENLQYPTQQYPFSPTPAAYNYEATNSQNIPSNYSTYTTAEMNEGTNTSRGTYPSSPSPQIHSYYENAAYSYPSSSTTPANYNTQMYNQQNPIASAYSSQTPVDSYIQQNPTASTYASQNPPASSYALQSNVPSTYLQQNPNYPSDQTAYYNYANYPATSQPQIQSSTPSSTAQVEPPRKSSNVDLLAGLDFSISQAPLTPQISTQNDFKEKEAQKAPPAKSSAFKAAKVEEKATIKLERPPRKDAFQNPDAIKQFSRDLEKFEKFVDGLTSKTANGQTLLDMKWKAIQDFQNVDSQKKSISVARCYAMKNRYPDILPYDFSRVELKTTNDDYINASHIKDVFSNSPPFIITQAPLATTHADFWAMVWEQQIENIVCIMSDNELGDDIYWPKEPGKDLAFPDKIISLQSVNTKEHWTERKFVVNILETRETRVVSHLQFTVWPGSIFPVSPSPFMDFVKRVLVLYQQTQIVQPILVHCSSGIGRSGLFCLLAILHEEIETYESSFPDIPTTVMKLYSARKNILRDREHLKFAYIAFLYHLKEIYKRFATESLLEPKIEVEPVTEVDPLSTLDPLWATRKAK